MPSEKRDRQRQNRESGHTAKLEAAKAAKKKKSMLRSGILVAALLVLVVGGALMASGGGDDDSDEAGNTTTTAESATTTTEGSSTETTATTVAGGGTAVGDVKCDDRKPEKAGNGKQYPAEPEMTIDTAKKYTVTFDTSCGEIVAELNAKDAPHTVNSFVFLAREGFYDGLTFHRVVKDFVIQGGDPDGTGGGGPGYEMAEEPPKDGEYPIGSLAMAKTSAPKTTGSQFFVVTGSNGPKVLASAGTYSYFGKITKGLEAAQKMESFYPPEEDGTPTRSLYMFKVSITESA